MGLESRTILCLVYGLTGGILIFITFPNAKKHCALGFFRYIQFIKLCAENGLPRVLLHSIYLRTVSDSMGIRELSLLLFLKNSISS